MKNITQIEDEKFEKEYTRIGDLYGIPTMGTEILKDYLHSRDEKIATSAVLEFIGEMRKEVEKIKERAGNHSDNEYFLINRDDVLSLLDKAEEDLTNK